MHPTHIQKKYIKSYQFQKALLNQHIHNIITIDQYIFLNLEATIGQLTCQQSAGKYSISNQKYPIIKSLAITKHHYLENMVPFNGNVYMSC